MSTPEFQADLQAQSDAYLEWVRKSKQEEMDQILALFDKTFSQSLSRHVRINYAKPQNVSREWAKMFLANWNRAVEMWDGGELFSGNPHPGKLVNQRYYARLCCIWMIPNGFAEPHVAAEGG